VASLCGISLCLCGGCGTRHTLDGVTPRAFVAGVERRCGVAYEPPPVRGDALGFSCGDSDDKAVRVAVVFTQRAKCRMFVTLQASNRYRAQGCISVPSRTAEGRVTCRGNARTIWARVLAGAQMVSVRSGANLSISGKILSLNPAAQARWGGVYFQVLKATGPFAPVLIERDERGRVLGRTALFRTKTCEK
jgi:hypothetical protein